MDLKSNIRTIIDYPRPGIRFRDITPLLRFPEAFRYSIDLLCQHLHHTELDGLVAVDSRGFLFASALAYRLHLPLFLARKTGKLPGNTIGADFKMEYSASRIELQLDAFPPGTQLVIIDDLIATGATLSATIEVIEKLGGCVVGCAVVIELTELGGRARIAPFPLSSLVSFCETDI